MTAATVTEEGCQRRGVNGGVKKARRRAVGWKGQKGSRASHLCGR